MAVKRPRVDPKKIDPSQTGNIRRKFEREFTRRFRVLKQRIKKLIALDDTFGLSPKSPGTVPQLLVRNKREFVSVQANVSDPEVLGAVERIQRGIDPNDLLKLEENVHVTVRYGIHTEADYDDIQATLQGKPSAKIGKLSLFRNAKFDVLKYDVISGDLKQLNTELGRFPHTDTHAEYHPHLTIAYLKSATGWKYVEGTGIDGADLEFSDFEISFPNYKSRVVPLSVTTNARFQFLTTEEKIKSFRTWLGLQMTDLFMLGDTAENFPDAFWHRYIRDGYEKGAGRAFDDANVQKRKLFTDLPLAGFSGTREEFLRASFAHPVSLEKLKLLAGRVFTELQGITSGMDVLLTRTLTDGLVQGKSPHTLARDILKDVAGIEKKRAKVLARTEVIRAHAEGQLDVLGRLGVEQVGAMVEWSTAGDGRVCPKCRPLDGIVLTLREARGLLPRHPNCFVSGRVAVYTADGWTPIAKICVGDLVLTHKGRFRKVNQLHKNWAEEAHVVEFRTGWGGTQNQICCTDSHPIMVNGEWLPANEIQVGDQVRWLTSCCHGCGSAIPYGAKYCGVSCQWENQEHRQDMSEKISKKMREQYATGERDGKCIIKKAHERIQTLISQGSFDAAGASWGALKGDNNPAKQPESRVKISESKMGDKNPTRMYPELGKKLGKQLQQFLKDNPHKHANHICAQKGHRTKIEKLMEEAFREQGLLPEFQFHIEGLWADFAFIEQKLVVECDGEYWHQDQEKEQQRDDRLKEAGWDVVHLKEKEILDHPNALATRIKRLLKNHDGLYNFADFSVTEVFHRDTRKVTLYNLSVEEDESFIVKGCVVHNCRCVWEPANVGEPPTRTTALKEEVVQKRSKRDVEQALDRSIRAEIPKGSKRTLAQQKEQTKWVGADADIDKTRPKSILDGPIGNVKDTVEEHIIEFGRVTDVPSPKTKKLLEPTDVKSLVTGKRAKCVVYYVKGKSLPISHGSGTYYGLLRETVEHLGVVEDVESKLITLKNPIVVGDLFQLTRLKMQIEFDTEKDLGGQANLYEDPLHGDQNDILRDWMLKTRHDALVLTYKEAAGGQQVVVFSKKDRQRKAEKKVNKSWYQLRSDD